MYKYWIFVLMGIFAACSDPSPLVTDLFFDSFIYPDYKEVTIPSTIAPLSFRVQTKEEKVKSILQAGNYSVTIKGKEVSIPARKWKKMLQSGDTIRVDILYQKGGEWKALYSFPVFISRDEIDPYLTYRLIAPGYEVWNFMGIYQRDLLSYTESPIYENKTMNHTCVNCHITNQGNPQEFIFHQRPKPSGTILVKEGTVKKLNTNYTDKVSSLVYPSWHPDGDYIAFSVNKTKQSLYANNHNRIEVWDEHSDIALLDVQSNSLITIPKLTSEEMLETYPAFSPDGKTLYFCSARKLSLPDSILHLKYDICSIPIDLDTKKTGKIDTVIHASANNHSTSFPRVSPNGRFLLYTQHSYGSFSIWHKDADLKMYDLEKKTAIDVDVVNSLESESYHSWSSNGRWIVFSSRRGDGLYTRPYIAHIDENGRTSKPFLLPQKSCNYYLYQNRSYNIPEFMTGKVNEHIVEIERLINGK